MLAHLAAMPTPPTPFNLLVPPSKLILTKAFSQGHCGVVFTLISLLHSFDVGLFGYGIDLSAPLSCHCTENTRLVPIGRK